jgi:hypothetical protein
LGEIGFLRHRVKLISISSGHCPKVLFFSFHSFCFKNLSLSRGLFIADDFSGPDLSSCINECNPSYGFVLLHHFYQKVMLQKVLARERRCWVSKSGLVSTPRRTIRDDIPDGSQKELSKLLVRYPIAPELEKQIPSILSCAKWMKFLLASGASAVSTALPWVIRTNGAAVHRDAAVLQHV